MTCHGSCGHPACDSRPVIRGQAPEAAVSGYDDVGANPAGQFFGDLFSGRDPVRADRERKAAAERARREAAARARMPAPKPKPPAPKPGPKPPPASHAPPRPGMTCGPWRKDRATPLAGGGAMVQSAPGGWWRQCKPRDAFPPKPTPKPPPTPGLTPEEEAEALALCASAEPAVIAQADPETVLWWLTCGQRADADVEALFSAMFDAGRGPEADAIIAAVTEGAEFIGAVSVPREGRMADDVLSSIFSAVAPIIPGGGIIEAVNRTRREAMYGPPPGAARPKGPTATATVAAVREAQRLVRASRKGDAAATASLTRAKVAAEGGDPEARRRWAVMVAAMVDHDKRVDALTEGRAPALATPAVTPAGRTPAAPKAPAGGGAFGGGGGFLGLLGGGGR